MAVADTQQSPPRSRAWAWLSIARPRRATLIGVASVLVFLAAWAAATETGFISKLFLPSPVAVARSAVKLVVSGELWASILASSARVFLGFLLAIVVAVPLGVAMAVNGTIQAVLAPFVSLLRPLPSITWIPLTILWLGIGEGQKVLIVFLGSWIYVLLSTYEATRRVDPILIRAARNLGASDFTVMREVVFPGALPGIIGGLKVTLAISWSCVLSAEMVAARRGLGAIIWNAKEWGDMTLVLVGMAGISLTVLVADMAASKLERLLLPWERHKR